MQYWSENILGITCLDVWIFIYSLSENFRKRIFLFFHFIVPQFYRRLTWSSFSLPANATLRQNIRLAFSVHKFQHLCLAEKIKSAMIKFCWFKYKIISTWQTNAKLSQIVWNCFLVNRLFFLDIVKVLTLLILRRMEMLKSWQHSKICHRQRFYVSISVCHSMVQVNSNFLPELDQISRIQEHIYH
jgi:hypothetical protein